MTRSQSQEALPSEPGQIEQATPVTNPRPADTTPTRFERYGQYDTAVTSADANTQPIVSGHPSLQPEWPMKSPTHQRSNTLGMGFCLGVATSGIVGVLLVLALAAGVLYASHGGDLTSLGGPNGVGELTGAPSSTATSAPTKVPTAKPVATHSGSVPTSTNPQPGPTPPPAKPTAPPQSSPPPAPRLSVSPQQASGNCLLGKYPNLTVKNAGGGQLSWGAHTSDGLVHVAPSSGTLSAGRSQSVSLSGLHVGTRLTITFSGNGGSATVTITCG